MLSPVMRAPSFYIVFWLPLLIIVKSGKRSYISIEAHWFYYIKGWCDVASELRGPPGETSKRDGFQLWLIYFASVGQEIG